VSATHQLPPQARSFLRALGAGPITPLDSTAWWFPWADTFGVAARDGEETQYELTLVEDADADELRQWLASQPVTVRDWLDIHDREGISELTFSGAVDPDLDLAQVQRIRQVLEDVADMWARRAVASEPHRTEQAYRPADDPMDLPAVNAWLVFGSESSTPSTEGMAQQRAEVAGGDYTWKWTVNKATRAGDLLLFYFTAPSKSLKYVARAASDAFFERATAGNDQQSFGPSQWWAYVTPLIPLPEIGTKVVVDLLEQPVLRGASGKYCKPDGIRRLQEWIQEHHPKADVAACLPLPLGQPQLPEPDSMSLTEWRVMADGALYPEKVVESHVVQPLVRFILADLGPGYELRGQHRLGRHRPDHVLFKHGQPHFFIETKVAVRRPLNTPWSHSPDFRQAAGYARRLGARAALIDAQAIYLLSRDLTDVERIIDRRDVDEEVLTQLRDVVCGS
jgi:hypothetical protein